MYVANITNILNERVCALQTILLFSIEKNLHHQHYQDFKMKKNAWHKHVLNEKKNARRKHNECEYEITCTRSY